MSYEIEGELERISVDTNKTKHLKIRIYVYNNDKENGFMKIKNLIIDADKEGNLLEFELE